MRRQMTWALGWNPEIGARMTDMLRAMIAVARAKPNVRRVIEDAFKIGIAIMRLSSLLRVRQRSNESWMGCGYSYQN